jgi:hypothetical protein
MNMIVLNLTMYNIMCKFSENSTSIQKNHRWTFVAWDYTKEFFDHVNSKNELYVPLDSRKSFP